MYRPLFPGGASGKIPTCQCRRHKRSGFGPWVGKIPQRRAWQPTPVFLPGESPWTEDPDELQSIGSQRVRHDWSSLACMQSCAYALIACVHVCYMHCPGPHFVTSGASRGWSEALYRDTSCPSQSCAVLLTQKTGTLWSMIQVTPSSLMHCLSFYFWWVFLTCRDFYVM